MNSSNDAHISDQELMEQFYNTHDNRLLGTLLQRYTMLLLGVCMKYLKNEELAKDCVQHIFLKAISELQKYQVAHIKSWLYKIACNHCLTYLRDKHESTRELSETIAAEDELFAKADSLKKDAMLTYMEEALDQLNAEQKTCVTLFYLQKKSYSEISAITGYSMMQVKSSIQNGKRKLKQLIEMKLGQHNA
ncbi:RNA polymerase sigma factor [Ilyomonas limi]|nr:sigma-70 family RNA polymerase sigma factor [Ilyomonas limi]